MDEFVTIKGLDTLERHLNNLSDPHKTLDNAIKETAILARGELARATLTKSHRTINFEYSGTKFGSATANNLSTGNCGCVLGT